MKPVSLIVVANGSSFLPEIQLEPVIMFLSYFTSLATDFSLPLFVIKFAATFTMLVAVFSLRLLALFLEYLVQGT
jgi:hypothetical protein